jgi:hypothetical protein
MTRPKVTPNIPLNKRTCTVKGTVVPKDYAYTEDIKNGVGRTKEINTIAEFNKLVSEFSRNELLKMNLEGIAIKNNHFPWDYYNLNNQDYYIGKVIKQNANFPQLDITGQIFPQTGKNAIRDLQKKDVYEKLKDGKYLDFSSGHIASYEHDPKKNTLKITKDLFEVSLTEQGAREGSYLTQIDFGQNDIDDETAQSLENKYYKDFKTASTSTTVKLGKDSKELVEYLFPKEQDNQINLINNNNNNNTMLKTNSFNFNNINNNNNIRVGSKNLLYTYSFKNKTKSNIEIKMATPNNNNNTTTTAQQQQQQGQSATGTITVGEDLFNKMKAENEKLKASYDEFLAMKQDIRDKNVENFNNDLSTVFTAVVTSLIGDKKTPEELSPEIQQQIASYQNVMDSIAEDYNKALDSPDGKIDASEVLKTLEANMSNNKSMVECFSKHIRQLQRHSNKLQNELVKLNSSSSSAQNTTTTTTTNVPPPTTTTNQNKTQTTTNTTTVLNSANNNNNGTETKQKFPKVVSVPKFFNIKRNTPEPPTTTTTTNTTTALQQTEPMKETQQTQLKDDGAGVGKSQQQPAPTAAQINNAINQQLHTNSKVKKQKIEFMKPYDDEEDEDEDDDDDRETFNFKTNPFDQLREKSNGILNNKSA